MDILKDTCMLLRLRYVFQKLFPKPNKFQQSSSLMDGKDYVFQHITHYNSIMEGVF